MLSDFFTEDIIGIAHDFEFIFGNFADDSDAEAWAWEWLAPDEGVGHAEFFAEFADFIFKELVQRFDQLELEVFWQAANVVVRLDGLGGVGTRFNHVGVERALG